MLNASLARASENDSFSRLAQVLKSNQGICKRSSAQSVSVLRFQFLGPLTPRRDLPDVADGPEFILGPPPYQKDSYAKQAKAQPRSEIDS